MLKRVRFLGAYILFWIGYFIVGRLVFLAYEAPAVSLLPAGLIVGIPAHGLVLDLSAACWLSVIPFVLISRSGFIPTLIPRKLIGWYTVLMLVITSVLITTDMELFAVWGSRIDSALFPYLRTPNVVFQVVAASPRLLLLGIFIALMLLGVIGYRRLVLPLYDNDARAIGEESLGVLILLMLLVVPIRGGIGYVALSQSSVYFSNNDYVNRAALNPAWNFVRSLQTQPIDHNTYRFTSDSAAMQVVDSLLGRRDLPTVESAPPQLLRMRPEKIVLIIWESLTAKIVEPLGGMRGITPNLSRLAHEGILFDGLYASGERTPKGLPGILSGFPSQPMALVLESADKSKSLPSLNSTLARAGYHTVFVYGGNPNFVNIRRYLLSTGVERMIEREEFGGPGIRTGLGVSDHIVLRKAFEELGSTSGRVFLSVLTLSSHEPYNIPMQPVIDGRGGEIDFLNSQVYADRSVGNFIARAKRERWWDSTLVIITADHGHRYPLTNEIFLRAKEDYAVPMLWLGGALAVRDTTIHRIASQIDIPKTLLSQLGIPSDDFRWSKNILLPGVPEFAYYSFPDLFGYVDRAGSYVFDNVSHAVVYQEGKVSDEAITAGRSFQQYAVQGYVDLGPLIRRQPIH